MPFWQDFKLGKYSMTLSSRQGMPVSTLLSTKLNIGLLHGDYWLNLTPQPG